MAKILFCETQNLAGLTLKNCTVLICKRGGVFNAHIGDNNNFAASSGGTNKCEKEPKEETKDYDELGSKEPSPYQRESRLFKRNQHPNPWNLPQSDTNALTRRRRNRVFRAVDGTLLSENKLSSYSNSFQQEENVTETNSNSRKLSNSSISSNEYEKKMDIWNMLFRTTKARKFVNYELRYCIAWILSLTWKTIANIEFCDKTKILKHRNELVCSFYQIMLKIAYSRCMKLEEAANSEAYSMYIMLKEWVENKKHSSSSMIWYVLTILEVIFPRLREIEIFNETWEKARKHY